MATKYEIWAPDEATVLCIIPTLAAEIGLNESLLLRQFIFWIKTADNLRDGRYWTYQSLRDMKDKAFPFWSVNTINRTIKSLEKRGLIVVTDQYNTRKSDKTRWFAIVPEALEMLQSIEIRAITSGIKAVPKWNRQTETQPRAHHNEATKAVPKWNNLSQNGTGLFQNGTTLPETPTETPTEKKEKTTTTTTESEESTGPPETSKDGGGDSGELKISFGRLVEAYEANIGLITPMIADELKDMGQEFSVEWISDAMRIAVTSEKRNLRYVRGILKRWKQEGRAQQKNSSAAPVGDAPGTDTGVHRIAGAAPPLPTEQPADVSDEEWAEHLEFMAAREAEAKAQREEFLKQRAEDRKKRKIA